ncbi:MAG: peptide ABC transporter substrate-binding protein [Chloroflexi bacterium]|nr:peptide ABC transporter substrate-binding protein [Chloroflexota bacterium]
MRLLAYLAPVLLLIAVACGSQAESDVAAPTSAVDVQAEAASAPAAESGSVSTVVPTPGAQAAAPDAAPITGGTFIRLYSDPPTLDPHLAGDTTSAGIIVEVFGGLATIDKDLQIAPDLAESWDISNGGRTYTFHLRENATFHDGRKVTAQDIKWSIERAGDPATQAPTVDLFLGDIVGFKDKLKGLASDVSGVRVIDDRTIEITADAPKAYFLAKLTYPTSFVLDKNNVTQDASWLRAPNGTGPFRLAEYTPGEVIRLTAFEGYHLGPPKLAEVLHILSGGDAMLMYENDELHVTGVSFNNLDAILDPANPLNRDVKQAPAQFSTYYMGMNVNEPPFDDVKVRLALNYAIDRDTISRTLLKGLLVPAIGVLPPGFPGYQESMGDYTFDPEKARQLLSESKYGANMDEFPDITLSLPGSFGASISSSTEAILEMWRQTLGIEVDVLQTEWATYLQDQRAGRFQLTGGSGWIADYPDPENFLDILLHSKSSNNHIGYSNLEVDDLLERARTEQDQEKRFGLYNQAERLILKDAPWIPLWHGDGGYVLLKPNVRDYFLFPMVIPRLRYVYLTDQ